MRVKRLRGILTANIVTGPTNEMLLAGIAVRRRGNVGPFTIFIMSALFWLRVGPTKMFIAGTTREAGHP